MYTRKLHLKLRLANFIVIGALVLLTGLSLAAASIARSAVQTKAIGQFEADSAIITTHLQTTLNNYSSGLYTGRAFLLNSTKVEPAEWQGYFNNQDIFNQFKGISSLSYVELVTFERKNQFEALQKSYYGQDYSIKPAGNRSVYALFSLIVSKGNIKPSGFDVYSTPDRLAIYEAAKAAGVPRASGEITLFNGQRGLFLVLPVNSAGKTVGFVNLIFHTEDFFAKMISTTQMRMLSIKVTDITETKPTQLYASSSWRDNKDDLKRSDNLTYGGRMWRVDYVAPHAYNFDRAYTALPYMILGLGLLLICVLMMCYYIFFRAGSHEADELALQNHDKH